MPGCFLYLRFHTSSTYHLPLLPQYPHPQPHGSADCGDPCFKSRIGINTETFAPYCLLIMKVTFCRDAYTSRWLRRLSDAGTCRAGDNIDSRSTRPISNKFR